MKFKQVLKEFKKLNLPEASYVIYGSGPLGVRGIREIHDLDVVVNDNLYQQLLEKYPETEKKFIKIGNIEIIPARNSLINNLEDVITRADVINGLRFVKLEDLLVWKKKMGRQKDFKDIKLIENYLKPKN